MAKTMSDVPMPGTWPQSGTMADPAAAASSVRASCSSTTSLFPPRSVIPAPAGIAVCHRTCLLIEQGDAPAGFPTGKKIEATGSGELLKDRTDRPEIACSEQVEAVEQMVQIVDRETLPPPRDQGVDFGVGPVETVRETAEEIRHSQFSLCPAEVAGRVDQAGLAAWTGPAVARPKGSASQA